MNITLSENEAFRVVRALTPSRDADDLFLAVQVLRRLNAHGEADALELECRLAEQRKLIIAEFTMAQRQREQAADMNTITAEERATLAQLREGRARIYGVPSKPTPIMPPAPPVYDDRAKPAAQAGAEAVAAALNIKPVSPSDDILGRIIARGDGK